MRRIIFYHVWVLVAVVCFSVTLSAQNGFTTGLNGRVINLPCNQSCISDIFQIPHLKATTDYTVNTIAYKPYAYSSPTAAEDLSLYLDDQYSTVIDLPFNFCFYDSVYPKAIVGSNGLITFDVTNASCENGYRIEQPIPYALGTPCNQLALYYPRASIMAAYSDLDPTSPASNADRKISWWVEGTAPFRRFIVSYYRIGAFGNGSCTPATRNTFQIVVYESTGVVEVFTESKACQSNTNAGRAIMGVQNWARNRARSLPGKNNAVWTETNTGYRFTPSGGDSRFVSAEIVTLAGVSLAAGDTITTTAGLLDLTFPGFCPSAASGQYIVRTTYSACEDGSPLVINDTITVNKTNSLNATGTVTPTSCAPVGTGTATIDIPAGLGTSPYTYVLTPGNVSQTGNNVFTGLTAGNYSIAVTDASGGCNSTVPVTIVNTGTLNVTHTVVNTSCTGASNGSITVNPPVGTPPITYSINSGAYGNNNVFSGLAPGNYQIQVRDNAGCAATLFPVTVAAGPPITITTSATPTSCPGANNGSVTVTGSTGTAPLQYSINSGAFQASPTFSGLAPGTYFLSVRDAVGCTVNFVPATVTQGTGSLTGTATATATSCNGAANGSISVTPTSGSGPYEYTINNGGNWQPGSTFSNLAAGNYTVKIREGGICTSADIAVTVNPGATLSGTATSTPTACAGVNNGSVTVTASAGFTGPFEYALDGGAFQASNTFNGVAAGNHNAVVRNATGCVSGNIPVTVDAGTVIIGTLAATTTSCNGAADGTITATPTNGGAPYQYALDGGANQPGNIFNAVAEGTHTVVITDNFGCVSNPIPITINPGAALTGTATATPTACAGVNNGSVTVTVSAGFTGPFEYALDGGTFQASNNFTAVSAGAHNVVIRNTAGCVSANIPVTVPAGTVLTGTASATSTSCSGAADGTITATATNGGGPYLYSLDGGANQPGNLFTGITAGNHSVVIADNFGCVSNPITVTINVGSVLTGTVSSTPTACAGVNNGSVTVTVSAGFTGPFEYALDGGAFQSSSSFSGVAAGNHNITIRNTTGCVSPALPVTVSAGTVVTGNITAVATSCNGAADGSVTATPTNGGAPYLYSLDGGANQPSGVFTGIAAGTHTIIITDNFGCVSNPLPVAVNAGSVLTGTVTSTATACAGVSNGSVTVTVGAGFTGPFEYALDGGAFQPAPGFTGVAAGNHTVVIRNAAGCISPSLPVAVSAGTSLNGTATATNVSCNGLADAVITVTPTNGSGPYQYALDGGANQSGNTFPGIAAGAHSIVITDAFGCVSAPVPVAVTQPAVLTAPAPSVTAVVCNGASNGSITIHPAGGISPYTYSINNTAYQSANTFNVAQGTYPASVRDANGCLLPLGNIVVIEPAALTASVISTTNATCGGGSDGAIEIAASGGVAPYQYSVNGTSYQSSNILNVTPGSYTTIVVRDANNCVFNVPNTVVGLTDNLSLAVNAPAPICEGSGVQLEVNSNAAVYAWTGGAGGDLSSLTASAPVASPHTTTTYTVTATLGNCSNSANVTVTVLPAPVPDAGADGNICFGQDYQLQGSGGLTYTWTPSTFLDNAAGASPLSVRPEKTVTYSLSVTDANNCPSLVTDQVVVHVTPPIEVFTSPSDTIVYAGDQLTLFAFIPGTDTSYTWTPAIGLSDPNISTPTVMAGNVGDVMTYKVTVTTSAGCQGEATVIIRVYEGPDIYVVTAFTPNGDGKNDVFIPIPVGIRQLKYFRVFNRWGQQLFATKALGQGWDGTVNGVQQAAGVYIWMTEAVTENGTVIKKRGTVTLIR